MPDLSSTGIPVKGTNELVTYLAANLLAGNRRINVAHYVGADNSDHSDTLQQAFQEAGGSPRDKVTYFHNKIINSFRYDHAVYKDSTSNIDARTEYTASALALEVAGTDDAYIVCSGYAQVFQALLNQVGIESWYVTGNIIDPSIPVYNSRHAWNVVNTGEGWTAVDVTWDDSQSGPAGTEFLMVPFDQGRMASRTYDTDSLPANVISGIVPEHMVHENTGLFF
jgi:transglutaminase-like putative cysteine protease